MRGSRRDELGELGRNLDELSRRLSAALCELRAANITLQKDIDRERELERAHSAFFAAASHELKTPITILKGQLSGMLAGVDVFKNRDKYLARSLAVAGRMENLVREMLAISRMESHAAAIGRGPVKLSAIVAEQLEITEDLALQTGRRLSADISPDIHTEGDAELLGMAVANLLVNAVCYCAPGGPVSAELFSGEHGPVFRVKNSGEIPPGALPHLFEAFYRVEGSHSRETGGSGLGLYLVRVILERPGAACEIINTPAGVQATVYFNNREDCYKNAD